MPEESKWYEKLHKQCPKCKNYDAIEFLSETETYNFGCKFCDFEKHGKIISGPMAPGVNKRFLEEHGFGDVDKLF